MATPKLLAIGAAVQDVFLSHSDEFTNLAQRQMSTILHSVLVVARQMLP
jgi:hypothetical protein